jgi:Zn-dependent protease
MSQFYQVDSTKVSLREYWWGSRSPLVIIGWLLKWLRVRIPSSSDDANTDSTIPFVTTPPPLEVQPLFAPLTQELSQLGFYEPVFHVIYDPGSSTTLYWATFLHTSGQHLGRIHHRAWGRVVRPKPVLFPMFITGFTDGTFLVSSSGKPDMAAPATIEMIRKQGAKVQHLWAAHEQRLQQLSARKMIRPVKSRHDLIAVCEDLHILQRDFHLARGVFRPRTEAETAKAQATATKVEEARAGGFENAEVLVELEKLQNKKTSKQMALWILIGSIAAYFLLGRANWSWEARLWLFPVLLFHELGHWVTMRLFKYRNLQMFFIPMFGAAVMGRNWNIPGWKKALVSLAGPIPGIIVGLGLGVASIVWHVQWMNKAALLLLVLNGMNLLPIFPMDGGHVLQTTIFCRNRWLEIVFRLLAIGGLLLLSVSWKGFMYLGISLAVTMPMAFKLAKVKEDLSKLDLPQPSPGEDAIPMPTAQAIITAVKTTLGSKLKLSNKVVAQHTLNVFESLNAKPPGVLATLGLMAIQGAGLFISVVMCLILVFTGRVDVKDFTRAAMRQPRHSVTCNAWQQAGLDPVGQHHLIVATFQKERKATAAFSQLTNQIPTNCLLTLYGENILLSIPVQGDALREKWFDAMQEYSTNLFVQVSNAPVALSMTFIAPNNTVASNLTQEVHDYLYASGQMHLIAPWSPEAHDSSYPQYKNARSAWRKIENKQSTIYNNAEYKAFGAKIRAAAKRGAMDEVNKLTEERRKKETELRAQLLEQFENEGDNVTTELARLYGKLEQPSYTNRVERQKLYREVAAKLGQVHYVNDMPEPEANSYTARGGSISMHGLLCELQWANFEEPRALITFTKWLCDKGCTQLKYDLEGGWPNFNETDEDSAGL